MFKAESRAPVCWFLFLVEPFVFPELIITSLLIFFFLCLLFYGSVNDSFSNSDSWGFGPRVTFLTLTLKGLLVFILCVHVLCLHARLFTMGEQWLPRPDEGIASPGTGYEPPSGWQEPDLGALTKQPVLSATEPSRPGFLVSFWVWFTWLCGWNITPRNFQSRGS